MRFTNRTQAGQLLAERLAAFQNKPDVIILALPRGGVPVAYEMAKQLKLPLDILLVRKLGMPGHEEYAMGAYTLETGAILDAHIIKNFHIAPELIKAVVDKEHQELLRRQKIYRGERKPPLIAEKTVILVDDGIATGSTMLAAAKAIKQLNPAHLIIAVPVASKEACEMLEAEADELICLSRPEPFYSVGLWYRDFNQVEDNEVIQLLAKVTSN